MSAALYYGKKLLSLLLSLLLLSAIVFCIARLAPGDALMSYYGERVEKMSPEQREAAREALGLNDALPVQYWRWLGNALRGNFGISYQYKQDVLEVIGQRIGNTLLLGGLGFLLTFAGALALGLVCAWHEDRWLDRLLCRVGTALSCVPEFWLSLLLILLFAVSLHWLPSSGAYDIGCRADVLNRAKHLILPMTVVVLEHLWYYAYMLRNCLLEELRADYVLLARAKGLSRRKIMRRHCLRNALPAYLSMMAISVPHVLGGTYIVETVFSYPGVGALAYESARCHDYNLLMLLCMMTAALVIVCNLLAQTINARIDPRMRDSARARRGEVLRQ